VYAKTWIGRWLATAMTAFLFVPASVAQEATANAPIIDFQTRFLPTVAKNGMVVAPERLAADIGASILKRGGNAVDAAVATGFALAVTYPRAGNIGGGGFMLIHLADEDRQTLIDYRETAPAAATADLYLNDAGEVDRQREFFSHQAAGVPGTVAGMLYALEHYGSLSRAEVLAPAIRLAAEGIRVSFALNAEITSRAERLQKNPEAARLFLDADGNAPAPDSLWRQPDLADTLRQIAQQGRDGFYSGAVARHIADDMANNGGLVTRQDLADYRPLERTPIRGSYRDFTIVSTPPPSSGGIHILQMLNILEGYDLVSLGHNSAAYLHRLIESMKLAYADRSRYLADPDYVKVPVAELVDKDYAARLRARIRPDAATPSASIDPGASLPGESTDTTHYTVADASGNVVSNTYTLNFSFGSHIAVPGTGMLLNNEMADFSASPGEANAFGLVQGEANRIEGGKRPLSSMSPTLVFRDGQPWLATGSPGGSVIITTILQTLLNAMDFDLNIASAAAAPRVHHQWLPDRVRVEDGVSPDTIRLLENLGHNVESAGRWEERSRFCSIGAGSMAPPTAGARGAGCRATETRPGHVPAPFGG